MCEKKKIVDNQQIFPETAIESQRIPSLRLVKSLMHEDIIPAHWNELPGMTGPHNSFTARGPITLTAILFPQPAV